MTDQRKPDLALDSDPVEVVSTNQQSPPARRRGHGFAPLVFVAILLVAGFAAYTVLQDGGETFAARNGSLESSETTTN